MGRRSLRKIDPALDLSRHLRSLDDLPALLDVAKNLFNHPAPLEIEVGSGKGLFMATASGEYPQHNFLGIEVVQKYARFAAAKLAKLDRTNAVMIHGDAMRLFREMLPSGCAVAVHVYFPDPWWKKRHKKRRVMNVDFLRDVVRTLEPNGSLHFWTDVEEYFITTLELIAANIELQGPIAVEVNDPETDMDYQTHFERRMRQHGLDVFRAEFRKE